jgi:hypothetical protein
MDSSAAAAAVVTRWEHQRNGVYSLCLVGRECLLSGDGAGNLLAHAVLTGGRLDGAIEEIISLSAATATGGRSAAAGSAMNSRFAKTSSSVVYGITASAQGAVRSINVVGNKVVTAGEDGNVLVFDYSAITAASVCK